jgi:hypothetical protein
MRRNLAVILSEAKDLHVKCGFLALLGMTACARPEPRVVVDSAVPTDTIVRRVVMLVRTPTMMQRVTPLVHPVRAGAALDQPLVIRVLDQRGRELEGVPVKWSLIAAGDGATLRVVNAVTDTLGLSRATFIAGASADTQTVAAQVDSVGRIDFQLQVPLGSLRIETSPSTLRVGDSAEARVILRDLAGATLSGGRPHWGSTDTMALLVREKSPGVATVRARRVGRVDVAAWMSGGKVQDRATVVVRYRGEVIAIPASWRIDAGSYTGTVVAINARDAVGSGNERGFWRRAPVTGRGETILGWPPAAFPLRIAFDRQRSSERIAPQDSAAFWAAADQLEQDIGADLFTPATFESSRPDGTISVEIGSQYAEGHTFLVWNMQGDAYDGVVTLRHASTTQNAAVVTHELLHLIGFGHTGAWRTTMHPVTAGIARATPHDVAYAQLALHLRKRQVQDDALPALPPR